MKSGMSTTMQFAYWEGSDHSILKPFLSEWKTHFPKFKVIGSAEVESLLAVLSSEWLELFRRIQSPTAKSDIARLVYLFRYGGLYVDCHCGLRDVSGLTALISSLKNSELVLWENSYTDYPRPKESMRPIAGILLARANSYIVESLLKQAMENLRRQAQLEEMLGYVEYTSWHLCGAGCYMDVLYVPNTNNTRLKDEFKGRIAFSSIDEGPVSLYRHVAYKSDRSQHWSERQKTELLFVPSFPARRGSVSHVKNVADSTRLVMTLLVKDEVDIIGHFLEYHLRSGIDHLIVTDHGSIDGTFEILEEYEKAGVLTIFRESSSEFAQAQWVTRMAGVARESLDADWIVNSDADEFWCHPSGSLKTLCQGRNETLLRLRRQNMLPILESEIDEAKNSRHQDTVRSSQSPITAMTTAVVAPQFESTPDNLGRYLLMNIGPKVICRAANLLFVEAGNHDAMYSHEKIVTDILTARIYHYPIRSYSQFERKVRQGGEALARTASLPKDLGYHWRGWHKIYQRGELRAHYDQIVLSTEARNVLVSEGVLQEDDFLKNALLRRLAMR